MKNINFIMDHSEKKRKVKNLCPAVVAILDYRSALQTQVGLSTQFTNSIGWLVSDKNIRK